jgi:hypothetical protein
MSEFTIHQAKFKDGRVSEVVILCRDEPEPPMFFYEETVQTVEHVINYLKDGDKVWAQWGAVCIPIELVILPTGQETIEVVNNGQPEQYLSLANLPNEIQIF